MVVQPFWCRKICKIVCRVPRKRVKSKFLCQDADVIPLADKCIVARRFVCRNYDKVLMETGQFSDNLRVTENELVSGVDRAFKSSDSTFQNIGDRKECRLRQPLSWPTVWYTRRSETLENFISSAWSGSKKVVKVESPSMKQESLIGQ